MNGSSIERKMIREPLKVVVYMENCRVRGTVYLDLESRLSDFINSDIQFLPIKEATVESITDKKWSYKVNFMNLNKNYIVSVFPEHELSEKWK